MLVGSIIFLGGLADIVNPRESQVYITDTANTSRLFEDSYRKGLGVQSRDQYRDSQRESGLQVAFIGVAIFSWGMVKWSKQRKTASSVVIVPPPPTSTDNTRSDPLVNNASPNAHTQQEPLGQIALLEKFADLKAKGIISEAEFEAKKKQLLEM